MGVLGSFSVLKVPEGFFEDSLRLAKDSCGFRVFRAWEFLGF